MKAVTDASDYRVCQIRESFMVAGRWTLDVQRVVIDALNSAFDDGLQAVGTGVVRYRIVRWIALHQREEGHTHASIADQCGTTRETVTRTLARLRHDGLIWGRGRSGGMYGLTPDGEALARSLDSHAARREDEAR